MAHRHFDHCFKRAIALGRMLCKVLVPIRITGSIFTNFSLLFTKQQILHSSKLKAFEGDNFKFDENGSKSSKRVENTVGKGEIAHFEQFLLFPLCFQKTCTTDR